MQYTKDEQYVLSLYKAAVEAGELEKEFDRYAIGRLAGLNPKAVNAICKLLIQANFVKKRGEEFVYLTPHGEKLALRLLSEAH